MPSTSAASDRVPRTTSVLLNAVLLVLLAALLVWKAEANYRTQDPLNSNFFSFWLSGHMVWTGESPYDAAQFQAGMDAFHANYRPSKILQYPLPLMYFMAPVGALPIREGYFVWQLVCELIVALAVFVLLRRQGRARGLFAPITAFLLFFGPVFLSLQIGSVGAISLLALVLAILFLEKGWPIPAGLVLSLTLLKPPQALALVVLAGAWLLMRRQWRVILGLALGGLALLVVWLLRDPLGLVKFRDSSGFLLGHSMGIQSNVYSFAYLACGRNQTCMWALGSLLLLALLAISAYILWRNRSAWSDWEAFNLIIPVAFLCALYLYSYDQMLYVIPIVWIAARLLAQRRSYIPVFVFLIVVDLVSMAALVVQATTKLDLLSVLNTLLVLGMLAWLMRGRSRRVASSLGQGLEAT